MTVSLMDFHADWCGPCKTQDPILDELKEDWGERFELRKVNVDEQQDVANEYQVRSLPTLIVENDDGIVDTVEQFLADHDGKLRISLDSITEMAYYADEERAREAVEAMLELLVEHDAVGLFHIAEEVHDEDVLDGYRELFDGVVTLAADGTVTCEF